MTRGKTTPRGEAIAVRTRVLAQSLGRALGGDVALRLGQ